MDKTELEERRQSIKSWLLTLNQVILQHYMENERYPIKNLTSLMSTSQIYSKGDNRQLSSKAIITILLRPSTMGVENDIFDIFEPWYFRFLLGLVAEPVLKCLWQRDQSCIDSSVKTYKEKARDILDKIKHLFFLRDFIKDPELVLFAASCFLFDLGQLDKNNTTQPTDEWFKDNVNNLFCAYMFLTRFHALVNGQNMDTKLMQKETDLYRIACISARRYITQIGLLPTNRMTGMRHIGNALAQVMAEYKKARKLNYDRVPPAL